MANAGAHSGTDGGHDLGRLGLEDWLPRRPLDITAGHLVNVLIMFLGTVLVLRFVDPLMRGAIHTPMRTSAALILVFMANTAACVAALMFLDEVIWRVPAGWALTIGTAVLAAGWRRLNPCRCEEPGRLSREIEY